MPVQHTAFILKVLSGINAGASVRLKIGSVVIGRSMNSDIILHDEAIADQHVRLQITQSGITLQPLARPVFVEEVDVAPEGIGLQPYQTVRLGNVEFMVVDAQGGGAKVSAASSPAVTSRPHQADGQVASLGGKADVIAEPDKKPTPKKSWGSGTYAAIGLALLLLGNLIFFAPQLSGLLERSGMVDSAEKRASALLESLGRQDFKLQKEADGSVSLRGYSRTTVERNTLMQQIHDAGIQANVHIWSQEEMADSAATIARSLGELGIKMGSEGVDGKLVAQGFVSQSGVWDRVKAVILSDVGGVRAIDDAKLQSMDGYMASFVQFVEKNGLSGRLKITTDGKKVIVKGELTQQEVEKVGSLRKEFIDTYGVGPAIALDVTDVRARIKLAIRSVSVGKAPFMVSKDGKKYMEGSAIGDNYFVKSIAPDHVVLINNGMEIPFYYGIEEGRK
ncbi:MAG: type III secretion system inner membrane ring subunit SctD [Thiothrix sp.]|uniref:type III secretion system inner membrane ring subunit SctD n=1 Tax=Thiothrix sp. TaxID=1032 RepID=UPI002632EDA6|nr:type III secretion system inner membrane ring subunit SctD [Thiothrix sp.]MDD5394819.1 type III secretion system inner membrane ring subunit SctD [Thiothrix sp.]